MSRSRLANSVATSFERLIHLDTRDQPLPFRVVALPIALLYTVLARLRAIFRNLRYPRPVKLPGFTISIGNIAVGGTGKTPVLIAIARALAADGLRVAVLTRGYGTPIPRDGFLVIRDGEIIHRNNAADLAAPDESLLASLAVPDLLVIASPNRVNAARKFLNAATRAAQPDVWLLDDGFQHFALRRDLDIVLLDAHSPIGNGRCLPAGPLREPSAALKRADAILLTRAASERLPTIPSAATAPRWLVPFRVGAPSPRSGDDQVTRDIDSVIVTAIARPERFADDVRALGFHPSRVIARPDHAAFDANDIRDVSQDSVIITTEKDFCRSPEWWLTLPQSVWTIPLDAILPEDFLDFLRERLALGK